MEAKYMLVQILKTFANEGSYVEKTWHHSCATYYLSYSTVKDHICYSYINLCDVTMMDKKLSAMCGAMLSGNYRVPLVPSTDYDYYSRLEFSGSKATLGDIYHAYKEAELHRISSTHHLHVSDKEIIMMYKSMVKDKTMPRSEKKLIRSVINLILERRNILGYNNKSSLVTLLTYVLCAPKWAIILLAHIISEAHDYNDLKRVLKEEGRFSKQLQYLYRDDLSVVYELDVLLNRTSLDVDWTDEARKRTDNDTVRIPSQEIYKRACRIFQDAVSEGKKAKKSQWKNYWSQRWASMPAGSVVSQYPEDIQAKRAFKTQTLTKAAWFANSKIASQEAWLKRDPGIYATTSTKYEWGKVRALYGCDVTSFLHTDFAMMNCEETLPSYFPVGQTSSAINVSKATKRFKELIPVCYDYDDFNSQHSLSSMRAVLEAWKYVYGSNLTDEQMSSLNWTISSLDSITANFSKMTTGLGKTVRVNGTLMSGWRLTSFMNTVLNRVYLEMAGLNEKLIYALHNGDDMYGGAYCVSDALEMMSKAKSLGIRAQIAKTNIGTIGEFLRVDVRAKNPTAAQYLTRACATMCHARVETSELNDPLDAFMAYQTRKDECMARGARCSVIEAAFKKQIEFVTRKYQIDRNVLTKYKYLHKIQGGINPDGEIKNERIVKGNINLAQAYRDERDLTKKMITPGVNDYIQYVADTYNLDRTKISFNNVLDIAVSQLFRDKTSYQVVTEQRRNVGALRAISGAWKGDRYLSAIAKVRTLGMAALSSVHMNSPLLTMLQKSKNPIELINILC